MSPETESETPGNETPESECRRVLGEERFADVQCQVNPLPPEVDRGAVYRAVTDGKYTHMAYASLSSELVRKRDKAVAVLRSDLNQLKRALEGSPWPPAIADLERAFRKATETEVLDDGSRRVPPLLFSREERRWIEPSLT
jgi:hypothetical protein